MGMPGKERVEEGWGGMKGRMGVRVGELLHLLCLLWCPRRATTTNLRGKLRSGKLRFGKLRFGQVLSLLRWARRRGRRRTILPRRRTSSNLTRENMPLVEGPDAWWRRMV